MSIINRSYWYEHGEDDAKSVGKDLPLLVDRLLFARHSYAQWLAILRIRRSVDTYREYLKGFTSVLPLKDFAEPKA